MFEPVGMAFTTTLVADGLEFFVVRIDDVVRCVAIGAHRTASVALREQLSVNAFVISLLDAQMTFAAGFGDVRVIDGRIAIYRTFDGMDTVAIVARRRDDQ